MVGGTGFNDVILDNPVHPLNALLPIRITAAGILISAKLIQF